MKKLYLHGDCIISPLGFTTNKNLESIRKSITGVQQLETNDFLNEPVCAGYIAPDSLAEAFAEIGDPKAYTKLEQMMLLAVDRTLKNEDQIDLNTCGLIVSTTKGNVHLLQNNQKQQEGRILLTGLANLIKDFFGFKQKPIVVSNACISGGLALSVAKKMINAGRFSQAIIVGGDMLSRFVVSGFHSFKALSTEICKPFSSDRTGINLGEAAAAIYVSDRPKNKSLNIFLAGDATANDANHISGPSRTAEGLYKSIQNAMREAQITAASLDVISTHGTATIYNDEMEAIAISRSDLSRVPSYSLKAFYGHTLGASALLEAILCKYMILENEIYPSLNSATGGVSYPLALNLEYRRNHPVHTVLKTAAGFGGCNIAMVFKKEVDEY